MAVSMARRVLFASGMDGQLKRPIDDVRAELLADPNTQQIAKNLGVELDEYVEEVLYFATHPDEEPELRFIENDKWLDKGIAPMTEAQVAEWLDARARPDGFGATREEKRKSAIDALLVAPRARAAAAPRVEEARGRVLPKTGVAGSGIEKQVVHARSDTRMDLERMRAQRGTRR